MQSFQDWLKDLATITKNRLEAADKTISSFEMTTRPTVPQRRALELLKVKLLDRDVVSNRRPRPSYPHKQNTSAPPPFELRTRGVEDQAARHRRLQ